MDTKISALFTLEAGSSLSKPLLSWWVKILFGTHSKLPNDELYMCQTV